MKWNALVIGLVFVTLVAASPRAHPQSTFENLDFEAANVADLPYPTLGEPVYITNGVPGWNISPAAGPGVMGHNSMPIGGAAVVILGPVWPSNQILQGNYTVELFFSTEGPPTAGEIFQSGLVPLGTKSVSFYGAGSFGLSFAGQQLPLAVLQSGTKYTVYGADISAFAGQTGELRFEGGGRLDNIVLSSQSIPEPSFATLLLLGTLALGLSRRKWIRM